MIDSCYQQQHDAKALSRPSVRHTFFCGCVLLLLQDALSAGHTFCLSANGVLLCEGPLPVQFVREVSAQELQQLWSLNNVQQ